MRPLSQYPLHWLIAIAILASSLIMFSGMTLAAPQVQPLWQLPLDEARQARIYETVIVPGDTPRVLATTPDEVLIIEQGKASTLLALKRGGELGQSALLPAVLAGSAAERGVIGVLSHNQHAVDRFDLVDFSGSARVTIDDPRQVYFRLSPDATSFVGLDTGNDHTALSGAPVTYRFFDLQGRTSKEREALSRTPAPGSDSAYSPDGALFYINSGSEGLTALDVVTLAPLWKTEPAVLFAAARRDSGLLLAAPASRRSLAVLYDHGVLRWAVSLADLGSRENIRNVAISPDGRHIAVSGKTRLVVLGPDTNEPIAQFDAGEGNAINSVAVSDSGVVAVGVQGASLREGYVEFLDARSGKPLFERQLTQHARSNAWIPTVQFDGDGRYLLTRTLERLQLFEITPAATAR